MSNTDRRIYKDTEYRGKTATARRIEIIRRLNCSNKITRETTTVDILQELVDIANRKYLTSFRLKLIMEEDE